MDRVAEPLRVVMRSMVSAKSPWPLFIHGAVGCGKTRAALSLADFAAELCTYDTVDSLCDSVMRPDSHERQKRIQEAALAILDELGEREKVADLQATTIKKFLDAREFHNHRVAIYISNLTPDQLPDVYDDRIASRLLAGTVFELTGPDRRRTG